MKKWYAVVMDEHDNDWGTGAESVDEALEMAKAMNANGIVVVEEGIFGGDPIAVKYIPLYTVWIVSGPHDGEMLGKYEEVYDAIVAATTYSREHEEDFDPVCGGLMILDGNGDTVEW